MKKINIKNKNTHHHFILIDDGSAFFDRALLLLKRYRNIKLTVVEPDAVSSSNLGGTIAASCAVTFLTTDVSPSVPNDRWASLLTSIADTVLDRLGQVVDIVILPGQPLIGSNTSQTGPSDPLKINEFTSYFQHSDYCRIDADCYVATASAEPNLFREGAINFGCERLTENKTLRILLVDELLESLANQDERAVTIDKAVISLAASELREFYELIEWFGKVSHGFFNSEQCFTQENLKSEGVKRLVKYLYQGVCSFERIYRYKPGVALESSSVAKKRFDLGFLLRGSIPTEVLSKIDCVVPVPETGKYYAQGLAASLSVPYIEAFQRNEDRGRSFDIVNITDRKNLIQEKLDLIPDLVMGKSIVLVDEAIFTGTTLKILCRKLRDSGVKDIYIALPTPPCIQQCPYGMQPPRSLLLEYTRLSQLPHYYDITGVYFQCPEVFDQQINSDTSTCTQCFLSGDLAAGVVYD